MAAPHIKSLLDCKVERFQALGHLFQGAIDLEKAGLVADAKAPEISKVDQAKLRGSALVHLRIAATQLPHLAEAQARYGVALILNQEPAMGRQYLQLAQRLGNLEPQYQIWAAWSVVQAGYPEDAEPIVARMLQAVEQGRLPRSFEGTLHLLNGEIHQARRSPADLKKAIDEYGKAFANGQDATPAVELRLAQIEVMLGRPDDALKRIDWLVPNGKAGPAAENLAVLTLVELKRDDDAQKRLAAARATYPESSELATLAASMLVKAKQPEQADQVLATSWPRCPTTSPPSSCGPRSSRSTSKRPGDARKLLAAVADRAENSAPMVQLALLELTAKDYDAAAETIARVRRRWKDCLDRRPPRRPARAGRNDYAAASAHFDAALKKDPNNKVVQFYKAQLDGRADPEGASKVFEALAHENSIKEIDAGLSLVKASQSALASIALESGDLDSAITRYREMLKDKTSPAIARSIRWQIVAALAAKKEWPAAKAEMVSLVNDPKNPADPRRAGPGRHLLPPQQGRRRRPGPGGPGPEGRPGATRGRRHPGRDPGADRQARRRDRHDPQGDRRLDRGGPEGARGPLPDDGRRRGGRPADRDRVRPGPDVLDSGLAQQPDSLELIQAKCRVLTLTQGLKAGRRSSRPRPRPTRAARTARCSWRPTATRGTSPLPSGSPPRSPRPTRPTPAPPPRRSS